MITRRDFIAGAAAAGAVAAFGKVEKALGAMAPVPKGAVATVPTLTPKNPAKLKILQLTDIHYHYVMKGIPADPWKLKDSKAMVKIFEPDMMINTGDFWAINQGGIGNELCKMCVKDFEALDIPWAFAWGNHDEVNDYGLAHQTLEKSKKSLYRGGAADGNYRVAILDEKGNPAINLIFLNNSRGGFKQEQIDWFDAETEKIKKETPLLPPAYLFFHIPATQYDDIAHAGNSKGVKFEKVCHENGSMDAVPAFKKAGFVRGMFCGHDHINDYHGDFKGVRLEYGRAMGGYGADKVRKGGKIITIDLKTGDCETMSVFGDGTSVAYDKFINVPEPGKIY